MSAYIPTLELEQLSLSPVSSAMSSMPTSSCSSFPSTSASSTGSASSPPKQVSFCPLALLIGVAGDGEVEMPMAQAAQRDLGRLGLAVRTYSLEAPNLGNATSRAWHSVVNGFSASLEPLLSSNTGSRGVVSRSRSRESSPERERERSRSRSPRRDYVSDEDDDPTFIPSSPTRLNIKLPTIRRKTSRTCLVPLCSKPILRNSPSPARAFNALARPAVSSSSDALSTSPRSSSCTPRSLPSLARTESHPPMPALHPEAGLIVPLAPCCTTCSRGTEYGLSASDAEYIERWTCGALRLREDQAKERREKEEWERQAEGIRRAYAAKRGEEDEKDEKEEEDEEEIERELEGSKLARKAVVDELQLERDKRGIKTTQERDEDPAPVLSLAFDHAATTAGLEPRSMVDFAAAVMTEEPESIDLDEPADETATPTPSSPTFPSVAPTPHPAAPTPSHSEPVPRPLSFPSSAAPLRSSPDKSTERPSQPAPPPPPPPPKRRLFSGFGTANTSLFLQSSLALAAGGSGTATATTGVP
ncbi:hypothetical protein JCM5296_000763 [Sporobolomyces johnsonii]